MKSVNSQGKAPVGRPPAEVKSKGFLVYPTSEERALFEDYAKRERRPLANAIVYLASKALHQAEGAQP